MMGMPAFAASSLRLLAAAAGAGALSAAASAATPSAADLARCAAIAAAESRLACYDALASSSAAVRPAAGATFPATPGAASPAPAAPAQSAAPPPPATEATGIQNFGLTAAQQHLTDLGPRAIQARITSVTRYEPGHASIALDNDQRWVVNEDDDRLSPGDRVTIKRAAMGSYMLLSPSNHTYHVRRVR